MGLIYPNASISPIKNTSWIDYITMSDDNNVGVYPEVKMIFRRDGFKIRAPPIHNALQERGPSRAILKMGVKELNTLGHMLGRVDSVWCTVLF